MHGLPVLVIVPANPTMRDWSCRLLQARLSREHVLVVELQGCNAAVGSKFNDQGMHAFGLISMQSAFLGFRSSSVCSPNAASVRSSLEMAIFHLQSQKIPEILELLCRGLSQFQNVSIGFSSTKIGFDNSRREPVRAHGSA
jgi:hypothetical protein